MKYNISINFPCGLGVGRCIVFALETSFRDIREDLKLVSQLVYKLISELVSQLVSVFSIYRNLVEISLPYFL